MLLRMKTFENCQHLKIATQAPFTENSFLSWNYLLFFLEKKRNSFERICSGTNSDFTKTMQDEFLLDCL